MGPLFYYELVRLARKGRSTLLRCAYAAALFVALFLTYRARFPWQDIWTRPFLPATPLSAAELSRLAERFVYSILWVQTLAVFVLAPVYTGSAIAEERERGTLDLLRMTHLSAREIVLGKLSARAVHPGGVLLAGLPLLALTQLWGGVDFRLLLAAFFVGGLNLLSAGAICVAQSALYRKATTAIFVSYMITLVQLLSCTALTVTPAELFRVQSEARAGPARVPGGGGSAALAAGADVLPPLVFCVVVNGVTALCFATGAVVRLYSPLSPDAEKTTSDNEPSPPLSADVGPQGTLDEDVPPPRPPPVLPPVGDSPLLWKERNRGVGEPAARALERLFSEAPLSGVLLLAAWAAMLFTARWEARGNPDAIRAIDAASRSVMTLLAGLWCGAVAFLAAAGISGERDGRTLDALLTLPVSRAALPGGPSGWGRC